MSQLTIDTILKEFQLKQVAESLSKPVISHGWTFNTWNEFNQKVKEVYGNKTVNMNR